jgi:pimeloyl-ACP methyl ester carboxylesterase
MALAAILAGPVIDMAKEFLFEEGKKVAHNFVDSVSGKTMGAIINYRKTAGNNNVLLFVHGFSGNSAETFGLTPDMLTADKDFEGWDIFSIGYSSDIFPSIGKGLWSVNPNITKIAMYLNTLLENQFAGYKRIAFVAHSMGGLAVQRAILDADKKIQKKISHVLFFGTPSAGLKKAGWAKFWNTQLKDLDKNSVFIKNLRTDWSEKFKSKTSFKLKTIAGSKDEFVPVESSLLPFDKTCHGVIEGNHVSMIKPLKITDHEHQSFQIILKTLTAQDVDYMQGEAGEINLLLGDYQQVINDNLENATELVIDRLIQLVFALECTGRKQEALKVLNEHPEAADNSDVMGVIGGRHKRNFLLSGFRKDAALAFEYYEKGLKMAEGKKDNKQIFYHAINLAFLTITAKKDEVEMKRYAQLALDNCVSQKKDKWELATVAEANLYLGNTELATAFYKEAAKLANARDRQSIYSNAFNGYQSLTAVTTKDDAFIKMLDTVFLKK